MNFLPKAVLLGTAFAFLAAAHPAAAQEVIKLDMNESMAPTNISSLAAADFARIVKEKSNGRLDISVHYSGSIGIGEKDMLAAVEEGVVPISSTIFDKLLTSLPLVAVKYVPFLAGTREKGNAMWVALRPYIEEQLGKQNQMVLFVTNSTSTGLWSKVPVQDIATLKKLKVRTNNPGTTKVFNNAGAQATFMAWSDVPPALATGIIDAVVTTDESGMSVRLYEQLKNFTRLGLETSVFLVHMNKDAFDKLPPDLQKVVLDSAEEARQNAEKRLTEREVANAKFLTENGVKIWDTVPPELQADLNKAAAPILEDLRKSLGKEKVDQVLAAFDKAQQAGN